MKIKKILNQNRRDFQAIFKCENCEEEVKMSGYDDRNFHDNVTPQMVCPKCSKSGKDLGTITQMTPY